MESLQDLLNATEVVESSIDGYLSDITVRYGLIDATNQGENVTAPESSLNAEAEEQRRTAQTPHDKGIQDYMHQVSESSYFMGKGGNIRTVCECASARAHQRVHFYQTQLYCTRTRQIIMFRRRSVIACRHLFWMKDLILSRYVMKRRYSRICRSHWTKVIEQLTNETSCQVSTS
jgi:hypothetical protein